MDACEEVTKTENKPKFIFLQEQPGLFGNIETIKRWYPTSAIVGISWNTDEVSTKVKFLKSDASLVITPPFEKADITQIVKYFYPEALS